MNNNELPIIYKMRQLYKAFYHYLSLFPKKDRYAIGNKCENYIIYTIELLFMASFAEIEEKKKLINSASLKFDCLKLFIRICHELRLLDDKKYLTLQKQIIEIGRMLGGWQRSLKQIRS